MVPPVSADVFLLLSLCLANGFGMVDAGRPIPRTASYRVPKVVNEVATILAVETPTVEMGRGARWGIRNDPNRVLGTWVSGE